ncbi:uncharacterized protein [Dermacentor andersoni]|uniref:uncharacterized protein isoform X2 n=1 Tax=Dermacentor andersoni TaxID=34620 RepID=UPI0024167A0E|nr:uncharacterized protein LOC129384322 [Dermacentor andersoni]XP_054925602.1 uncharacterized protein LOC129384322 [Dermacentor andersoni]XP_054925603.1 uncharacterized protein LOC129384322 [Dermacentor andersoni]XP_054925604.1 uncharacterized protein LOC129384322 [Dermacentor andersoni]XP_054925605.1 uncharacterized protein LOC129384322 [Dermacentor andersoni]XP_054925606.1 uncharacterized protein LOC129384322 [Dermacentor andersoni]XP_054925607.1 uncharacterized protein LOC129384322 [Dermac
MHLHLSSLLLVVFYWTYSQGQTDHSKIPLEHQKYMNCVREMLNNETQLFLKWGVGGTFRDNRTICWTSNKSTPLDLGYQRRERFYNTVETQNCWQDRDTTYYVGPVNFTPSVVVQAKKNGIPDPEVSGTFTIFFATPQCFVMGILEDSASPQAGNSTRPLTDNSTCLLWAQRHGNETVKKPCEDAFESNCSRIAGTKYKRGHDQCNLTDITEG